MTNVIERAKAFAIAAHGDQVYAKYPYAYHLEGVAALVAKRNKEDPLLDMYVAIAWLHDVIEDTDVTYEDLAKEFGICIAKSVFWLSKVEGQSYEDYMAQVKSSAMATEVKKCDTMFNLHCSFKGNRTKGVVKYAKQLSILEEK